MSKRLTRPLHCANSTCCTATRNTTPFHVPQCDTAWSPAKCTSLYHDQEQSPQSTGNCTNCGFCTEGPCDCGVAPCGEYLWDHRNGSMLRDFLVDECVIACLPISQHCFLDSCRCGLSPNPYVRQPRPPSVRITLSSAPCHCCLFSCDFTCVGTASLSSFFSLSQIHC
jgi:hypothetical protein